MNRSLIWLALGLGCLSCVEPFEPELREVQDLMVISGVITDRAGEHTVEISRSSPYNTPAFQPVTGCVVAVEDERGEIHSYEEQEPGIYRTDLPASFLAVGKSYALRVLAPDGTSYRSDYDTLLACPPVDSVYYEVMRQPTNDPDRTLYGLQFYSDLSGTKGMTGNFRWVLEETWEYKSAYTSTYIWQGEELPELLYADTVSTCYMTGRIPSVFTATTRSLSGNGIRRNPLNYVSNETPRLHVRYSLLVEQQSLTNGAFGYWDRLKALSQETGGLYETQPPVVTGNVFNTEDPEERVLGYFYATQPRQKRIFVGSGFEFTTPAFACKLDTFYILGDIVEIYTRYPIYLFSLDPEGPFPPYLTSSYSCFDCRLLGGSNKKPAFWEP